MIKLLRLIVALPALLFIVLGLRWLIDPSAAAESLGMPLLDGIGRSTQIGDLGAFFFAGGCMVLLGLITKQRAWFYAPALLLACTAIFRTLAWAFQGAALAVPEIAVEVIITALLLVAAAKLSSRETN